MSLKSGSYFADLATEQRNILSDQLPRDNNTRVALFVELTRVCDALAIASKDGIDRNTVVDRTLVQWGWNLAASLLLEPINIEGAFPYAESTPETRRSAYSLLRAFGVNSLLRRTAEMTKRGFVHSVESNGVIEIHGALGGTLGLPFDNLDFDDLRQTESKFFGDDLNKENMPSWRSDIDELMIPLLKTWEEPTGTMLTYDSSPEIDDHFLGLALFLSKEWRAYAGIHPSVKFSGISASDLISVSIFLASLHLKHVHFVSLYREKFGREPTLQSLTIWKQRTELIDALHDYSGLPENVLKKALEIIAFRASDSKLLSNHTSFFRPLIVDFGNGLDLRPISSLDQNPLNTLRQQLLWKYDNARSSLEKPREAWARGELYSLFEGTRYQTLNGNVKVKIDGNILTDIDAAVYDISGNEIALFQLKWQDFDTNSPNEISSKSKNFADSMRIWCETVSLWVNTIGTQRLLQKLRMTNKLGNKNPKVLLFGLSRLAARFESISTSGSSTQIIAVSNWPQFVRGRFQVGPSDRVLSSLHAWINEDRLRRPNTSPIPFSFNFGSQVIVYRDLFHEIER